MVTHTRPASDVSLPDARRYMAIDALRGTAMVWMTVFHFCFDLQYFRWIQADFYHDPFWTWQRSAIVSLFVFCAGLGQAVAFHQGQSWPRFFRRWGQVVLCAALVSVGSYWMFPHSYIYFGILHGVALMLLITRLVAPALCSMPVLAVAAGALALATPWWAEALHQFAGGRLEMLNGAAWNWLGLIGRKPVTEDYAPLLPWLGMMLWGFIAGTWLLRGPHVSILSNPAGIFWRRLALLGRWSLSYYMLHQPVMLGILMLWATLRPMH